MTSNSAGLSVPDWPNTYGKFMFSFPMSNMVGGIFYEHGHRMIASAVGFLTVILSFWLWRREERKWVRTLGYAAVGAVIAQGVLGGLTVLFYLPTAISVAHALLAQTFFCITLAIGYVTSREGVQPAVTVSGRGVSSLGRLSAVAAGAVFVQLLIGAWMRHSEAGLAIPDFPLSYGDVIPPITSDGLAVANQLRFHLDLPPVSLGQIWIHFAHRVGAVVVVAVVSMVIVRILKYYRDVAQLANLAQGLIVLIALQVTLGILTVLTLKDPIIATAHVACGALILGVIFLETIRAHRFAPATSGAAMAISPTGTAA